MSAITLVDCTFRDGGYYNDWDFEPRHVAEYLAAAASAKIDVIEIGFRQFPQERFAGPFAYSTDRFLAGLALPRGVRLGVMVNAAELIKHPAGPAAAASLLFQKAARSPVSLVRIAVHFRDVAAAEPIAARLKALGYRVCINLMQAGGKASAALAEAARAVRGWDSVDVLYFADSLGSMTPDQTAQTAAALRQGWDGPLGIHAHNSMNQAVANTMAAIEAGATWVDGTVLGMGRGPGNAQTECLLVEFQRRGIRESYADAVFHLVLGSFAQLQKRYGWGPNLLYYLSATYGIHPTYVQEMLGKGQYDHHQIIAAIESLRKADASGYSGDQLEAALFSSDGSGRGTWSARGWAKGRSLLIVAGGPSLRSHAQALESFIAQNKPVVVCLNVKGALPPKYVHAYAACHKVSLLLDAQRYRFLKKPLIAPMGQVPAPVRAKLGKVKVLDYGMQVDKGVFAAGRKGCVIPVPLVAAYALALAEASGAREILLAGFDGYGAADPRQHEMNRLLSLYQSRPESLPLRAMTPTTYEVPQGSIYAPTL